MKNFIALFLIVLQLLDTLPAFAKYESSSEDAESVVAYGKYGDTLVPLKVGSDGSLVGGAQGEDSTVIFNVKTEYGATGDGIHKMDGNITSGDATFTSASSTFTSADVGKVISIVGAGGATIDLTTTISSVTSATEVELAATASATVTNVSFVYGTDDTTEIQAAIDAVAALPNPFGEVFFPAGIYIVNGAFSGANNPSQLRVPTITRAGASKPGATLVISGPVTSTYQGAGDIYGDGGAVIYSTKIGTSGTQSILSGYSTNVADPGNCTQIKLVINNLTFRTTQNPVNSALILSNVQNAYLDGLLVDTAGINNDDMPQPTTSTSFGIKMPKDQNGIGAVAKDVKIRGFYNGILLDEHGYIQNGIIFYAVRGLYLDGINIGHAKFVNHLTIERTMTPIFFLAGGANYVYFTGVEIEHNCQGAGLWSCTTTDISDTGNNAYGFIHYNIVNLDGSNTLVTSGALNIDFRGEGMTGASSLYNIGNGYDVGIGMLSAVPTSKLQVQESDATTFSATAISEANIAIGNTSTTNNTMSQFNFITQNSSAAMASVVRTGSVNTVHTAGSESGDYFINTKNSGTLRNSFYITAAGNVGISNSAPSGKLVVDHPTAQTIAAGNTIAHDACGTVKAITSAGAVSTDTTNTFTAPAAGNKGCCMDVINVGANNITLDANANFISFGGLDVVLTANDAVRVCEYNGASGKWYQTGLLVAN